MQDEQLIKNIMASIEVNNFLGGSDKLLNLATGELATYTAQHGLTHIKNIETEVLNKIMASSQKNATTVHLNTFQTQGNAKVSTNKPIIPGRTDEVTTLLRLTQDLASGGTIDVIQYIGNHEFSRTPPALFEESKAMRSTSGATLVHARKQETRVDSIPELPQTGTCRAFIVDVMPGQQDREC